MSFSTIGNMNTYLKSMQMKSMWDLKKQTKDYSKKATDLDDWLNQIAKKEQEASKKQDEKLSEILQKVNAGKKLTSEEMEYLRDKAPLVYKELISLEQEQEAYERELRRCETKEEVERLRMNWMNSALVTVNAVSNNANIPEENKMGLIIQAKRRLDAINESTREFVRSGKYAELPTEAEEAIARKEQMEKLYGESEQEKKAVEEEGVPEEKENAGTQDSASEPVAETTAESEKAANTKEPEREKPEIHIESEEERKVRRAKAKAAYAALEPSDESQETPVVRLNRKA